MNNRARISFFMIILIMGVFPARGQASQSSPPGASIDPALMAELSRQPANAQVRAIAMMSDQVEPRAIPGRDRSERQYNLIQALRSTAASSQAGPLGLLNTRRATGEVTSIIPLWIQNAVAFAATPAVIAEVASYPGVARVVSDTIILAPAEPLVNQSSTPEANISLVNAPALWNLGYRGQGVVVAVMDTGVSGSHVDLSAQWRGGTNSWYDPYGLHPTTPTDVNGHGTWVIGIIVGRDASGTSIGVAPDAQWIAVKIFNDNGVAYASAIHQGYQWLLDPDGNLATADAPDVVNNSWAYGSPG